MSKKYIDREKVETWLLTETMCLDTDPDREYVVEKLRQDVPNEEVEPVIHCKDCDYWNEWDHVGRETLGNFRCSCAYWSNEDGPIYYTGGNDFCSYGERREEEP